MQPGKGRPGRRHALSGSQATILANDQNLISPCGSKVRGYPLVCCRSAVAVGSLKSRLSFLPRAGSSLSLVLLDPRSYFSPLELILMLSVPDTPVSGSASRLPQGTAALNPPLPYSIATMWRWFFLSNVLVVCFFCNPGEISETSSSKSKQNFGKDLSSNEVTQKGSASHNPPRQRVSVCGVWSRYSHNDSGIQFIEFGALSRVHSFIVGRSWFCRMR